MEPEIPIGRSIARLRYERRLTQDNLAAQLQCQGKNITRDMVAKMELGRVKVTVKSLLALQKVFRVPLIRLFPREIQEQDAQFAEEDARRPRKSRSRNAQS
jgi:transcriptional regulator with XRE-family HTH domain